MRSKIGKRPKGRRVPNGTRWNFDFPNSFRISVFAFLVLLLAQAVTLFSQPAPPPNRVLDLDGRRDYVQLPGFIFTNLSQATIEGWMKWRSFNFPARFFDFGERQREMYIGGTGGGPGHLNAGQL